MNSRPPCRNCGGDLDTGLPWCSDCYPPRQLGPAPTPPPPPQTEE